MTLHNLEEHLSWLLHISLKASPPAYGTPTTLCELDAQDTSTLNQGGNDCHTILTQALERDVPPAKENHEFVRPPLPKKARGVASLDMGKLQSGVKSNKKQLVSQAPVLTTVASTASQANISKYDERSVVGSRGLTTDRSDGKRAELREGSSSFERRGSQPCRSHDNTSDSDTRKTSHTQTSSSSNFEGFGESRPLWTADAARRVEPVRGKKRKSDELEATVPDVPRGTQDSFMEIDDLQDSVATIIPSHSLPSPITSNRDYQTPPRHQTPSKKELLNVAEISLTQPPDSLQRSSKKRKQAANLQQASDRPLSPRISQTPLRKRPHSPTERLNSPPGKIVADSEEENDIEEAFATESQVKILNSFSWEEHAEYPRLPASRNNTPTKNPSIKNKDPASGHRAKRGFDNNQKQSSSQSSIGASPFHDDSPTKRNGILTSTPVDVPIVGLPSDGALSEATKLLESDPEQLNRISSCLNRQRDEIAELTCSIMKAGADVIDVVERYRSLQRSIEHLTMLFSVREKYHEAKRERNAARERLLAAVNIGEDPDEDYNQKNKVAYGSMLQMQRETATVIADTPKLLQAIADSETVRNPGLARSDTSRHPAIVIQSTQANIKWSKHEPNDDQQFLSAGPVPMIQQTPQVDSAGLYETSSTQAFIQDANLNPPRTQDVTSAVRSTRGIQARNIQQAATAVRSPVHSTSTKARFARGSPSRKQENHIPMFNDTEMQGLEEAGFFTAEMGDRPEEIGGNDDLYDAGDDTDLLEAAAQMEYRKRSIASSAPARSKRALAETSGNAVKPPSNKSPSKAHATKHQAALPIFAWTGEVKAAVHRRFRMSGFRLNQLEAINATLAGKDTFVLMPTGGGKSLCYQLPSIVRSGRTQGVTLVISPLLSLMEDQVDHLMRLGIQAFVINGESSKEHRDLIYDAFSKPAPEEYIQLLYITPEMVNKSGRVLTELSKLHRRNKLARLVIDEAHCVSQWGHDFRPDYKTLGETRKQFDGVPLMALTATATENVKADVIHNLGMKGCEVFSQSFNRPNLIYHVIPKTGAKNAVFNDMLAKIENEHRGQPGIVYCLSRKNCETVAEQLAKAGVKAHHYHAGMAADMRSRIQKEWQRGKYNIIVATVAFGMGIDKPDVRFVIHHSIPKSLEGYYQETGRAGRDGAYSRCYLYYSYKDTAALKRFIDEGEGSPEQKERQRQMLRSVIQFCENRTDCRRVQVLGYFNERFRKEECDRHCDNCSSKSVAEVKDFTAHAIAALQLVKSVENSKVTLNNCIEGFRGAQKKGRGLSKESADNFGYGSKLDRGIAERIFYHLVSYDALREETEINQAGFPLHYIRTGSKYWDFVRRKGVLKLPVLLRSDENEDDKGKLPIPRKINRKKEAQPQSTNVSSPIRKTARNDRNTRVKEESSLHRNGYAKDGFVISSEAYQSEEDSESDGFEEVREAGKPRKSKQIELGPPITKDGTLEELNELQRDIVENFVEEAEKLAEKVRT